MSESFFILSGKVQSFNGERWIAATEGDFLYVPEGGVHAFHNDSGQPASMLILFAPGAPREAYFAELAEIAASGRQLNDEEWIELKGVTRFSADVLADNRAMLSLLRKSAHPQSATVSSGVIHFEIPVVSFEKDRWAEAA